MRNFMKQNKAITLIALVITIIVLLILAGVTIATLTGDNGLLTKATDAKKANENATLEEKIKLAVSAAKVDGEGLLTEENLNNSLKLTFQDTINAHKVGKYWYYKNYKINIDGTVEEIFLPDDYHQVEFINTGTGVYSEIQTGILTDTVTRIDLGIESTFTTYLGLITSAETYNTGENTDYGKNPNTSNYLSIWNATDTFGSSVKGSYYNNFELTATPSDYYGKSEIYVDFNFNVSSNKSRYYTFGNNGISGYNTSPKKIYYLKMYDSNNALIANFLPCYRKSDNTVGMYDLARLQFFTPAYGIWTRGPNV